MYRGKLTNIIDFHVSLKTYYPHVYYQYTCLINPLKYSSLFKSTWRAGYEHYGCTLAPYRNVYFFKSISFKRDPSTSTMRAIATSHHELEPSLSIFFYKPNPLLL